MLMGLLFLLDLSAATPIGFCDPATISSHVQSASALVAKKDLAGAKRAIDPVASCPTTSYPAFVARVVRGQVAVGEGDWAAARAALDGVDVHPEVPLSAMAGFLRLRADQGLNDTAAFARDRAALLMANDSFLRHLGDRLIEIFRVGNAEVTAYAAPVDQGPFRRVTEFIVVPDDRAAYPASITLTDDRQTLTIAREMAAKNNGPQPNHVWFVDLYTCNKHATLQQVSGDVPPDYAALKARVLAAVVDPAIIAVSAGPDRAMCFSAKWILPGLGRSLSSASAPALP